MITVIAAIVAALAGLGVGYAVRQYLGKTQAQGMESLAERSLSDAKRKAEDIVKESDLLAKAAVIKAREEFEKSQENKRKELSQFQDRLNDRELNVERKVSMLDKKEKILDEKIAEYEGKSAEVAKDREEVLKIIAEEKDKLQKVANMTQEDAKKMLLQRIEKEVHAEAGTLIRRIHEEAKENADRDARRITTMAIQRFASSHASEMTTSTVVLPNDDVKGRIIGRDGRNIRALESVTGVNILIDDTPEAVVISGFDPVRREIAKQSLEQLITDGRIHPARIEEIVAKVKDSMDESMRVSGEEACYKVGIQGIDPELLRMIGRLKYRSSYSQNVLQHSLEVSHLMGSMAGELGLDTTLARRIGLFHDIGKAVDHEVEGGHALIGADLLKKHGEAQIVVNAVAAHHEEVQAESLYAVLAAASDAISSSRLGARSETTEIYVKRLEKLEGIANSFDGVQKCYAIHAGRELRVIVTPDRIDDNSAMVLARDISKKIESELQYPGQIRVTVIRETRCVEYAK